MQNASSTRTLTERIQFELTQIRAETLEEAARIPEDLFEWAPAVGMKPYRDLLVESAVMERESVQFIRETELPNWDDLWSAISERASSVSTLLTEMGAIRVETLRLLNELGDEGLQAPLPSPASWNEFFGAATVEPEELFRWIARHEYYHLGQLIVYHWIRGDDPYKRSA